MTAVYVLTEIDCEGAEILGVFRGQEQAKAALERKAPQGLRTSDRIGGDGVLYWVARVSDYCIERFEVQG